MSKKQDNAVKRKAKVKAKKVHAEPDKQMLAGRIANAVMDLCAAVLPEYVDDSEKIDAMGRENLWHMGMIAWNLAVQGHKEMDEAYVKCMHLDATKERIVRDEINGFIRTKYRKYAKIHTAIAEIKTVCNGSEVKLKVTPGCTYPACPIPTYEEAAMLSPEDIFTKRKGLKLSQAKFAAALGISVKKLSSWEHGKAVPTEEELEKINTYTSEEE